MKILCGIVAGVLSIICFAPYLRDIFKKETKPHSYSWLIWSILQVTGFWAIIAGGGGYFGAMNIGIGSIFCLLIFFLSLKFGTKNITTVDTVSFVGALIAIVIWFFTKNPIYSVIMISLIDFVGFIPTLRKGYEEPHTETSSTYFLAMLSDIFALLALTTYSLTTSLYLGTLVFSNGLFVLLLLSRRKIKTT